MLIFLCPFNLDIDFLSNIVVTFPIGFAFILALRNYIKNTYLHNLLFMFAWLSYWMWAIFNALTVIYLQPSFALIAGIATISLGFFAIFFLDTISRKSIDPFKLSIVVALSVAKIMIMFDPNIVYSITFPDGHQEIQNNLTYTVISLLNLLFIGLCYFYYMVRIRQNAPNKIKSASNLNVWGAFIMGFFGPFIGLIFSNIAPAIIGIGVILTAVAFTRQPQLAYILPFKTYRLIVIDMNGGIPLFSHEWADSGVSLPGNFELFSAMLAGVNGVIIESLQKGGVRQIQLERSLLIIEPGTNLSFVSILITTQSSASLCAALKTFTKKFEKGYGNLFPDVHNTTAFNDAERLILECFPFVPSYV